MQKYDSKQYDNSTCIPTVSAANTVQGKILHGEILMQKFKVRILFCSKNFVIVIHVTLSEDFRDDLPRRPPTSVHSYSKRIDSVTIYSRQNGDRQVVSVRFATAENDVDKINGCAGTRNKSYVRNARVCVRKLKQQSSSTDLAEVHAKICTIETFPPQAIYGKSKNTNDPRAILSGKF